MSEDLGAINLNLTVDTSKFSSGLSKAGGDLKDFSDEANDASNATEHFSEKLENIDVSPLKAASGAMHLTKLAGEGLVSMGLPDSLGKAMESAGSSAMIFTELGRAIHHVAEGFGALATVATEYLAPIALAIGGIYTAVSLLVGAVKVLTGELQFAAGMSFWDKFKSAFGAGREAISEAGSRIKETISNALTSPEEKFNFGGEQGKEASSEIEFAYKVYDLKKQAQEKELQETAKMGQEVAKYYEEMEKKAESETAEIATQLDKAMARLLHAFDKINTVSGSVLQKFIDSLEKSQSEVEDFANHVPESINDMFAKVNHTASTFINPQTGLAQTQINASPMAAGASILAGAAEQQAPKSAGIINAGMQGFASGGIFGAIIAVIAKILSMTKFFSHMMEQAESAVGTIVELFDEILAPLNAVNDSANEAVKVILGFVKSLFTIINAVSGMKYINKIFEGIKWIFDRIADVWNGLLGWLSSLFHKLSSIPYIGKYFEDIAKGLNDAKIAYNDTTEKVNDMGTAISAVTGELNTPSGYKIAGSMFGATNDTTGPGPASIYINSVLVQGTTDLAMLTKQLADQAAKASMTASANPASNQGVPASSGGIPAALGATGKINPLINRK